MPQFTLRPDPFIDLYIVWTTVTDGPLFAGTEEAIAAWLLDRRVGQAKREIENDLARAARALAQFFYGLNTIQGPQRGEMSVPFLPTFNHWMWENEDDL